MAMGLKYFVGVLGGTTLLAMSASAALAQDRTTPTTSVRRESVLEVFERTYYGSGGSYFEGFSVGGQLQAIFGPAFPDNAAASATRRIDRLYEDQLARQTKSDPIVRTVDLPNPYSSSLLLLPSTANINRVPAGGELVVPLR